MELYLNRCIESLIAIDYGLLKAIDILIVNDGSKDKTSDIAHSYAYKYPDCIRVIDKENGHYGSCINAALPVASGKYFRILDADDWFDTKSLKVFLLKLASIDADCVCTNCVDVMDGREKHIRIKGLPYETLINLDEIDGFDRYIHMHHIAYRTSLLKEMGYHQTEGICYTDEEFSYYPLVQSHSLYLIDIPLYYYYIGRPDQSVNREVSLRIKHHYVKVAQRMIDNPVNPSFANAVAQDIRWEKISYIVGSEILPNYILFRKMTKDELDQLVEMLKKIKSENKKVFKQLLSSRIKKIPVYKIWWTMPRFLNRVYYYLFKFAK